jgi:hypothetical protein
MHELLPNVTVVAMLVNPKNPQAESQLINVRAAVASPLRPSLSLHSTAIRFFAISLTTAMLTWVRGPV